MAMYSPHVLPDHIKRVPTKLHSSRSWKPFPHFEVPCVSRISRSQILATNIVKGSAMMGWTRVISALISLALPASAFIRLPCSNLVTQRFDPLVTPGEVSPHVHQIVGGNAFNLSMDPSIDYGETATCTTCRFKEDKSNYWTAVLYFRHPNGSFIRVPQMANHNTGPGLQAGGMTVYYFQPRPPTKNLNIVPFAKGFRMITGNPMRRRDDTDPNDTQSKSITFRCFHGADPGPFGTPGTGPDDSVEFPRKPCSGGIRSNIFYPQCWDGVNLDPPDHASHVAHPAGGFFGTDCPDTHPVRLPLLFVEIVWDTRPFNAPELWPKDGSQPFVFSMGDPTGYGQHADYVFGWEGDSLKRAMDVCTSADGIPANCPVLTIQSTHEMNTCRQANRVPEIVEDQYLDKLPGCNPIQAGPEPATMVPPSECDAPSTTVNIPEPTESQKAIEPPWTVCHTGPETHSLAPMCDPTPTATGVEGVEAVVLVTPAP
ncbi:hypothetical protein CC2G_013437 [Coprinopsis cinerea AmutBmut pab1-1]|nr:hypothetical protein CC2G_013437 [Coprinopsis cinerea AmutBmut pab1-1]